MVRNPVYEGPIYDSVQESKIMSSSTSDSMKTVCHPYTESAPMSHKESKINQMS